MRSHRLFGLVLAAVPAAASAGACAASDLATDGAVGAGGSFDGGAADAGVCPLGQVTCDGAVARTCDGKGAWSKIEDCGAQGKQCADAFGCVVCAPKTGTCQDGMADMCDGAGSRKLRFACDPVQGMQCHPDGCHGACSPAELGTSYIGCDYWPTVTANGVWSAFFDFAVVVANASDKPAKITITRKGQPVGAQPHDVPPGELVTVPLPWVPELKGPDADEKGTVVPSGKSVRVAGGAYRLRSDRPVTVYQFNALQYENTAKPAGCPDPGKLGRCFSYSNDASLLLPANALTSSYAVMGWHALHVEGTQATVSMGDFVAVTATADGTVVAIQPSAPTLAGDGLGALQPGEKATVTLDAGDVVELFDTAASSAQSLSGTWIRSVDDKPIQVLSGVSCAKVPDDNEACDHLEETVLPVETLGTDYVVTVPRTPKGVMLHSVRLHGIADAATLVFDPPEGFKTITLKKGQALDLPSVAKDFRVSSTVPFGVTQYMHGQGPAGVDPPKPPAVGAGDPSESMVVPTPQFRSGYVFLAPADYAANFVNVVAPTGATVTLDGAPIAAGDFAPVGASGMSVARVKLDSKGAHVAKGDKPFGLVVYGYGEYTSYMVPGGLELRRIAAPLPK